MTRRRWPWVLLGAAGIGSIGVGAVGAQEGGERVNGLTAIAQSDGIGSTFGDPNAQPYPVAAGQIAHTEASLSTGPTGYALASTAWPGPLAANAGSLAVLLGAPAEAGAARYEGRAEVFSPAGPHDAELPGMRAHADGGVAEATAGAQDVTGTPGVATGDVVTISQSTFDAGVLTANSSCTASDIGFGDGAVAIGSVRTEATSSSDGEVGTAGGRTVVSGLTVAGQPAEVDENGVRFVDPVTAPVGEQILSQMGMEMFVAQPRETEGPGRASYQAGALVVAWEPPGSGQLFVYSICGSDAAASLRLGSAFTAPSTPSTMAPAAPAAAPSAPSRPSGAVVTTPRVTTPSAPAPAAAPAAVPPAVELATEPAGFVRDLSIWPYIVGALCCVASAIGLRRARDGALSSRLGVTACPLEGARP